MNCKKLISALTVKTRIEGEFEIKSMCLNFVLSDSDTHPTRKPWKVTTVTEAELSERPQAKRQLKSP
jgi:hypothetical protein